MRTFPVLLLCLAACGGASTSSGIGHIAGAGGPAGPPPTISWSGGMPADGGEFTSTGFPAVSDDGQQVLLAWQKGDGGRGYPNLALLVVDRADKVQDTRAVLEADEVDTREAPIDVAAPNAWLAESNTAKRWRPLTAGTVEQGEVADDEMYPTTQSARAGDIAVRFDDSGHLVIEQDGKVVVDTVEKSWLEEDRPMYDGAGPDEVCSNPIYLASLHADPARRLAVVGVEYRGTDTCWEPTGQYHVVAW